MVAAMVKGAGSADRRCTCPCSRRPKASKGCFDRHDLSDYDGEGDVKNGALMTLVFT
jgi:hypothetical protein